MQSAMSIQYGAGKNSEASSPLEEKQELDFGDSELHFAFHLYHGCDFSPAQEYMA